MKDITITYQSGLEREVAFQRKNYDLKLKGNMCTILYALWSVKQLQISNIYFFY